MDGSLKPKVQFIFIFLISSLSNCIAQRSRPCPSGSECVSLLECRPMLDAARSPSPADRLRFRQAICGFSGIVQVCCPRAPPPTPTPRPPGGNAVGFPGGNPTPRPPTSDDLLPKSCGVPSTEDRIIGGKPAPIGAYPWVAALGYTEIGIPGVIKFDCGGSVITEKYVVTAGHCVHPDELGSRRLTVINLGDWDLSTPRDCQAKDSGTKCNEPHLQVRPRRIVIHPDYNKRAATSDDIALIEITPSVNFNSLSTAPIKPICLPNENHSAVRLANGRRLVATGWGLTENFTQSNILLRVFLPFADEQLCKNFYTTKFVGNQLCVGGTSGQDTCNGDSGGSLVLSGERGPPFVLVGIVSIGPTPCGNSNIPGIYTDVAKYVKWIKENLTP